MSSEPQKDNRILYIAIGVIVGLLIVIGIIFWANGRDDGSPQGHQVKYEVSGGSSDVNVIYTTSNGRTNEQALRQNATLNDSPWQHEFTAQTGDTVSITAEDVSGATVPITCRIYVDDQLFREATGTTVTCEGTVGG